MPQSNKTDSLSRIDAVDGSVALILDRPIADCGSEQSLVATGAGNSVRRDASIDLHFIVLVLDVDVREAVESLARLYFLEGHELVESRLTDRNDLLEDVPENALSERRSRKRTRIGPALFERELLDKGGQVKPEDTHHALKVAVLVVLSHLEEEPIVGIRVAGEVGVRNDLEEEAKDAV